MVFKAALTYDDVQIVPKYSEVKSRQLITTKTRLVDDIYINHPLIPANMDSISSVEMMKVAKKHGSICFLHRFSHVNKVIEYITKDLYDISPIGFSIGVGSMWIDYAKHILERIKLLNESSKIIFLLDVAHAHHLNVKETLNLYYKDNDLCNVPIIVGNVSTSEGARFLVEHGARGIKCGQGNGKLCSTRIQTGAGIPQLTAIMSCYEEMEKLGSDATIIADGGIKYIGDIVKAIGAGANSVMSGFLFAGTKSTPGDIIRRGVFPNEQIYKIYRGSASRESKLDRGENGNVEGVAIEVPYNGSTERIFDDSLDGIRSGLSYAGFDSLKEGIGNMDFIQVSTSSIYEAFPNGIYRNRE